MLFLVHSLHLSTNIFIYNRKKGALSKKYLNFVASYSLLNKHNQ
ncbi:MAG: hypothetical protein RI894_1435 [Bacteroidota bacterium]|jgi:hypothetical protein